MLNDRQQAGGYLYECIRNEAKNCVAYIWFLMDKNP
jgi:hypothetical protein